VISYYAKRIAQDVKPPSQFAVLVPKDREFLRDRAFGEPLDLTDKAIISAIATGVAQYVTFKTFATVLRVLIVEELSPTLEHLGRALSETEPFPFSRPTFEASKTVFNLVAPDDDFEREFAQFLQDSSDVASLCNVASTIQIRRRIHRCGDTSPHVAFNPHPGGIFPSKAARGHVWPHSLQSRDPESRVSGTRDRQVGRLRDACLSIATEGPTRD